MNNTFGQQPQSLDKWILEQPCDNFPPDGGMPYKARFQSIAKYLNEEVHPHVEKGALLKGDGYLTDHGPRHIETVVRRASRLLSHPQSTYPQLTAYEVYLLLLAIHFHDVGNIFGRAEHEQRHSEVMAQLGPLLGNEMVEKQAILRIARVHGGKVNGSKDTISTLIPESHILGHDVRYQLLAAILRFADELADDSHRAARFPQKLGIIPEASQVHHEYAKSLNSVRIRPEENIIDLRFSFTKNDALRTFGKSGGNSSAQQVYLLDEIFERSLKMHTERKYCMRFTRGVVYIDVISVRIEIYNDSNSMTPCVDPIGYRLREHGYPSSSSETITDICPELTINGSSLKQQLRSGD